MADNQHRHWILPIYLGGDYRESNAEWLSPQDHAEAHRLLWEQHGHIKDILPGNLYQSSHQKFKNYPWRNRKLFVEESETE